MLAEHETTTVETTVQVADRSDLRDLIQAKAERTTRMNVEMQRV